MPRLNLCNFLVPYTMLLLLLPSNVFGLTVNRTTKNNIYPTSVSVVTLPMDFAAEADVKLTTMPTILGSSINAIDNPNNIIHNNNNSNMNRTASPASPQTIPIDFNSAGGQVHRSKANVSRELRSS